MDALIRWLLTYLVHSTLLVGAAIVVGRILGERRLALQEALLRAALLGGFLTAGLQLALDLRPLAGSLTLASAPGRLDARTPSTSAPQAVARSAARATASFPLVVRIDAATAPQALPPASRWSSAWPTKARRYWPPALLTAWVGLALLSLVRLVWARLRLRRLLSDRRPVRDHEIAPGTQAIADALGLRGSVRMTAAPRLSVPAAIGVLRPEVCLPTRVFAELRGSRSSRCARTSWRTSLATIRPGCSSRASRPRWRRCSRSTTGRVDAWPIWRSV